MSRPAENSARSAVGASARAAAGTNEAALDRALGLLPWLAVAVAGIFGLRLLDDFDTWWHLAAGRWILGNAAVPSTDVLSYTVPEQAWTNLQWLYDILLYALYSAGGAGALVVSLAVTTALTFALLSRNVGRQLGPVATTALLLVVLVVAGERIMIRPEMATFVLLQAVLLVLARARDDEGRRLWMLAPLMLVWANMHALFVVGAAVIAAHVAGAVLAETPLLPWRWREASRWEPAARRRLLLATAAAAAAVFINPFFVKGALFPLELFTRIDGSDAVFSVIGEFRPPFSGYFPTFAIGAYQAWFVAGCALVLLAGLTDALARGRRYAPRFDVAGLIVFALFAWLSLLARRNIGVFVLASAPFVALCLRILADRAAHGPLVALLRWRAVGAAACVLVAAGMTAAFASNAWFARFGETHSAGIGVLEVNFPIDAARFVRDQDLPGRLYNDLTAGGYLTWADPAGDGVYIDGRLEVYDEFFGVYQRSLGNPAVFLEQVERFDVGSVLLFHRWGNRHGLIGWLGRHPEWILVYHDPTAAVFTRRPADNARLSELVSAGTAAHRAAFEALLAAEPSSGWDVARYTALASWARLHVTLGDYVAADRLHEALLAMRVPVEQRIASLVFRGNYLEYRGEKAQAAALAERVLKLDPDNADALALRRRLAGDSS